MRVNSGLAWVSGFILGAVSWGVVALVSDRFEPFDSGLGFCIGQILLSTVACGIAFHGGWLRLLLFLFGAYLGMNTYAYAFGTSETRAWIGLGLITTLALLIIPFILGLIGYLLNRVVSNWRKRRGLR